MNLTGYYKFFVAIVVLFVGNAYASQMVEYSPAKGMASWDDNCSKEDIPKLIKSAAFKNETVYLDGHRESVNIVDALNERFNSFVWVYVLNACKERRVPFFRRKEYCKLIGKLESFKPSGSVDLNSPQGASQEWCFIVNTMLLLIKNTSIDENGSKPQGRSGVAGVLSIEGMYGSSYNELIEKRLKSPGSSNIDIVQENNVTKLTEQVRCLQDKNKLLTQQIKTFNDGQTPQSSDQPVSPFILRRNSIGRCIMCGINGYCCKNITYASDDFYQLGFVIIFIGYGKKHL